MRARGKNLVSGVSETIRTCKRGGSNAREVVALTKNSERRVAEIIAQVTGHQPDEQLAKDCGLPQIFHEQAAESGTQRDEDGSDQNGDNRVGMREVPLRKETSDRKRTKPKKGRNGSSQHAKLFDTGEVRWGGGGRGYCRGDRNRRQEESRIGRCMLQCAA